MFDKRIPVLLDVKDRLDEALLEISRLFKRLAGSIGRKLMASTYAILGRDEEK